MLAINLLKSSDAYMIPGLKEKQSISTPFGQMHMNEIETTVLQHTGITLAQIKSQHRYRAFVEARQLYMFFLYRYGVKQTQVGRLAGGRDHSTVIHALKTVNNIAESDPHFTERLAKMIWHLDLLMPKPITETLSPQLQNKITKLRS
jgi:chromosomal replication initiation ATPase DnaA